MMIDKIKRKLDVLILPIISFLVLFAIVITLYDTSIERHYAVVKGQVDNTGELLSKEFKNIVISDISRLENLKNRLEVTNGSYFANWEDDANLLLQQNPSFKFIEWIDSSMVIKKINPYKGNEQALNLDISKIEYRNNEWIKHSTSGKTNITSWEKLTQPGHSFLVDVPVHFNNRFQGTITAGMDFNINFNRLVAYLENQYAIELYDDKENLFYKINKEKKLKINKEIDYDNFIIIDEFDKQQWHLKVFPSEKLLAAADIHTINIAMIFGVLMSLLVALLIHFYLTAKKGTKLAIGANLTLKNINEKLNEERVRAEKASQAKTDFLSNMSHEIRTPLHAIIGFIQLLKNSELNKTDQEYIDLMDKSSNNLLSLINDILDIDKIESGNTELDEILFNPLEKIKDLINVNHFLFLKKNLYLNTNFENTLGMNVIGDQNKFLQVINNLLKNALKFTNKGGVLFTYNETIVKKKLKIIIMIEDTGIGIPKKNLNNIFNRFTQLDSSLKKQYEGSGLGLAISEKLVTIMGGDITVKSKISKGSKFQISILFNVAENQKKEVSFENTSNISLKDLHVLIVDDNNLNIIVLKKLLENIGIKADTAENGKIAIQKVKEKKYQLIFMDIHMPEMDGFQTTKIIRKNDKKVVIFGLSANATTHAIDKAVISGMNNYLSKPFKKEHLYKLMLFHFKSD